MDGFEDLYITGGVQEDKLYRNNGDRTYEEVSSSSIYESTRLVYTQGVTVGDIDNDGFEDVFVCTGEGYANILLHNNGNGTFADISLKAGIAEQARSMGATFGDYNLDGYLDLYVTNYIEVAAPLVDDQGDLYGFAHECYQDYLYINNRDNSFTEAASDFSSDNAGCGLTVITTDFNQDALLDIYIANDFGEWIRPNQILLNNYPSNSFDEVGGNHNMNVAFYAMRIAVGDIDNDGLCDYYVTNLGPNALLHQESDNWYYNLAETAGVVNDMIDSCNSTGWEQFFLITTMMVLKTFL